jgi:hypothetical protein
MVVRLSDPSLAELFLGYLRRADCVVALGEVDAHTAGVAVTVQVPAAYDEEHARREVAIYLRVWDAIHSGSGAELLD